MMFVRHTLFWKYAAYFSGLVSALLILSGGVGGLSRLSGIDLGAGSAAGREGAGRGERDRDFRGPVG